MNVTYILLFDDRKFIESIEGSTFNDEKDMHQYIKDEYESYISKNPNADYYGFEAIKFYELSEFTELVNDQVIDVLLLQTYIAFVYVKG